MFFSTEGEWGKIMDGAASYIDKWKAVNAYVFLGNKTAEGCGDWSLFSTFHSLCLSLFLFNFNPSFFLRNKKSEQRCTATDQLKGLKARLKRVNMNNLLFFSAVVVSYNLLTFHNYGAQDHRQDTRWRRRRKSRKVSAELLSAISIIHCLKILPKKTRNICFQDVLQELTTRGNQQLCYIYCLFAISVGLGCPWDMAQK